MYRRSCSILHNGDRIGRGILLKANQGEMYADLLLTSVNLLAVIELPELANGKLYFDELVKNDRCLWTFSNLQFEEIEKTPSSRMIPTKLEEAALHNEKLTSPLTEKMPSRKVTPQDNLCSYERAAKKSQKYGIS